MERISAARRMERKGVCEDDMRVKALVGFAGQVCAAAGEVLDLPAGSPVLADLIRAGYVEPEEEKKPAGKKPRQEAVRDAPE